MLAQPEMPQVGTLVRVRQRTYLVEEVVTKLGTSPIARMACVDDDALGQRLEVIWAAELDAQALPPNQSAIKPGAAPDAPATFAAYLLALRWGCVTSTDPTLFQAPLRAGIVPKSYQLEPLRKALALPRVNLFIADDVGLGKTIEAGLILQELLLRQRVRRVVISCPASVVLQWRDELSQRFGLSFVVLDKAFVNARRRERGFGVNPWTTHRFFILSHNLLRDEDYLIGLRQWLGGFCPGSLFILDEAHVAAPSTESKYAVDSQTTRAVRDIARRFEHRLFLSATPHNGHSNAFSSLLEILDPHRFTRGVPVTGADALRPVMVRRLKGELRKHLADPLPERHVIQVDIDKLPADAPELALAAKLAEYAEILDDIAAAGSKRVRAAVQLVCNSLQKRLLSCIDAFARTLSVHRKSAGQRLAAAVSAAQALDEREASAGAQVRLPMASMPGEDEDLTEDVLAELEALEVARATRAGAIADKSARASALLEEMTQIAERARGVPDAKLRALTDWVRRSQCPDLGKRGAKWLPCRVLIFTEYAHTKEYLIHQLAAAIAGSDREEERILTLHGGMDEEERERVKQCFNDAADPVRILIGTDAAREGVNLQAECANLFHFDLPWNPGRMEQRNGRIDRLLGQPQVFCHYFYFAQRPEDKVLKKLVEKTERIQAQLGSLADVIDQRLTATMAPGIRRQKLQAQLDAIDSADASPGDAESRRVANAELESVRDRELVQQLLELTKLHDKAERHLDYQPTRLRDVVNLGLRLCSAPELTPRTRPKDSYDVPPLDLLARGDVTWREVMDTLRKPRTRKQPEWQWRADNPPRPVSFTPATTLSAETVQLHLAHKLAQRALAPFRAQGFGEDQLSRISIALDPNYRRARVLCIGRLSLYGPGASRLHEELLVTAAYWSEDAGPRHLEPFKSEAEERALDALLAVLGRSGQTQAPPHIQELLLRSAASDEAALWSSLQARAAEHAAEADKALSGRARVESQEMQRILQVQLAAVEKELVRRQQLAMPWAQTEREQQAQYEADSRYLDRRRAELQEELTAEPGRVRDLYTLKHQRLERVGLVYLWPTTS